MKILKLVFKYLEKDNVSESQKLTYVKISFLFENGFEEFQQKAITTQNHYTD